QTSHNERRHSGRSRCQDATACSIELRLCNVCAFFLPSVVNMFIVLVSVSALLSCADTSPLAQEEMCQTPHGASAPWWLLLAWPWAHLRSPAARPVLPPRMSRAQTRRSSSQRSTSSPASTR